MPRLLLICRCRRKVTYLLQCQSQRGTVLKKLGGLLHTDDAMLVHVCSYVNGSDVPALPERGDDLAARPGTCDVQAPSRDALKVSGIPPECCRKC